MMQIFNLIRLCAVAFTVVGALSACTQPTAISSIWHEIDQSPARPYDRILVVGVSDVSN